MARAKRKYSMRERDAAARAPCGQRGLFGSVIISSLERAERTRSGSLKSPYFTALQRRWSWNFSNPANGMGNRLAGLADSAGRSAM
jgi:hypothetical protein